MKNMETFVESLSEEIRNGASISDVIQLLTDFNKPTFSSGIDKQLQFHKELKSLLLKYDAELCIEDFDRNYNTDDKIVIDFNWDKSLAETTDNGIIPQLIIGKFETGK